MARTDYTSRSADHGESRLDFETLISDLSSRFINLPPGEVDREIEDAQRRVCEALGVDLSALWEGTATAEGPLTLTHFYSSREDLLPPMRGMSAQEYFPWLQQELLAGRIVAVSSLEELPEPAALDRDNLRLFGVKSNLTVPLSVGGASPVAALGFNTTQAERDWPDELVMQLQLVTQVFANALARKRADEALRASEARLEAGVELAGLAFYEVDFNEGSVYVDDRFRDLCGIPPDREQGLQALEFWIEHLHPDDSPRVMDERRLLHEGRREQLFVEYRFLPPGQGQKWIQHIGRVAARDVTGRTIKSYGVLLDVTQRKRAEDELHDLSQRLIGAHEEERGLLARELHDDVSQRLAVLAIDVGRAELAAPDEAQAEAMKEVRTGLVRLSEDIHSLAYQLHPSVLEELGLAEALQAECERRGRQGRLDLEVDLEPLTVVIGKDAALCLFRVAQEALNNVARHAGVCAARVTLRQMDGGLLLAVSDGGVGFDAEHLAEGMHLGLASMRERVRLVHGTLDIESAPDRGTTILAWVPAEEAS